MGNEYALLDMHVQNTSEYYILFEMVYNILSNYSRTYVKSTYASSVKYTYSITALSES